MDTDGTGRKRRLAAHPLATALALAAVALALAIAGLMIHAFYIDGFAGEASALMIAWLCSPCMFLVLGAYTLLKGYRVARYGLGAIFLIMALVFMLDAAFQWSWDYPDISALQFSLVASFVLLPPCFALFFSRRLTRELQLIRAGMSTAN